jgi:phosphate starvation-inducible PhoH-like protein
LTDTLHKAVIPLRDAQEGLSLFGVQDKLLKLIKNRTQALIHARDAEVVIRGEEGEVEKLRELFRVLLELIRGGHSLTERDVQYAMDLAAAGKADEMLDLYRSEPVASHRGKQIRVKTIGQKTYLDAIRKHDIVFAIGPAGTGKTYLAVAMAVSALKEGRVKRIVLTRPAVEAGESLGFLPGDLQEKVDPYLRPIYDALYDLMGSDQVLKAMERGTIEIAPLAYMRGRTLDDAFVILDEAQNTSPEQMKMFLTRLGFGSKMVITGDVTQIDLPRGKASGLIAAQRILRDIDEIGFVHLDESDVVRHSLVQKIIAAYNREDERSST